MTDARKLWTSGSKVPVHVDAREIAERAKKHERDLLWRNRAEYLAVVFVVIAFAPSIFFPRETGVPFLSRVGAGFIIGGALFVGAYLRLRGHPEEVTADATHEVLRRNLEQRAKLLASVPVWYLGPLVPGISLFHLGMWIERVKSTTDAVVMAATVVGSIAFFMAVGIYNVRGAAKLREQLAALPPEERSAP